LFSVCSAEQVNQQCKEIAELTKRVKEYKLKEIANPSVVYCQLESSQKMVKDLRSKIDDLQTFQVVFSLGFVAFLASYFGQPLCW
jgi:hypothetical protein